MTGPRARAAAVAIAIGVVLLFATPLRGLWARDGGPWWLPFAAWLPLIAALGWVARGTRAP